FSLLATRRPPSPTLFPYTTLFRSYSGQCHRYSAYEISAKKVMGRLVSRWSALNVVPVNPAANTNSKPVMGHSDWYPGKVAPPSKKIPHVAINAKPTQPSTIRSRIDRSSRGRTRPAKAHSANSHQRAAVGKNATQ